jgi:molybdenum ABC transporter molybdate-binding protein
VTGVAATPKLTRTGQIHSAWLAFLASVVVLAALIGLLCWNPEGGPSTTQEPLVVYCAAGLRKPVEAVAREYEAAYGVPVQLQYQGSQTLLSSIEVSRRGDLYIPADDSYIELARGKKLLAETIPLAQMTPVLAVPRGNPKGLRSFDDLLGKDVRLAQANPDLAAIGKVTRNALSRAEWEALQRRTVVYKGTVNDVATDVTIGEVDAGIIWDALLQQYPELEAVHLPQLDRKTAHVSVAVLECCTQPTAALRFARYLAARDKGLPEFARNGYRTMDGDPWAETPELVVYAGAMLQPAIKETLTAFEEREGVQIQSVYNGCGILVGQMKTGQRPDAYFACDKSFLTQVHDLFVDAVDVSTNQLVILVPKGNPHHITCLEDLGQPGLRVGVGHEKQCALGALTQETLRQGGFRKTVMKNVKVQSPTGDMLVNQLRVGSLDAVVAYLSNATNSGDKLEAIKINVPCALAVQPVAVGKETRYPYLTRRLRDALTSRPSRERFEKSGFHWQAPPR